MHCMSLVGVGGSCVKRYKNVCSYSQQFTLQSSQPEWFHLVLRRQSFLSPDWLKQIPLLFPAHWRFIPPLSPPVHLNLWQHLPPVPTEVTSLRAPWRTRAHLNWILEQHLIQALQNQFWHLNPLLLLMFLSYIRLVRGLPRTRHPYSTEAQLKLLVSAVSLVVVFLHWSVSLWTYVCLCWPFSRCQIIFGAFWRKVPGAQPEFSLHIRRSRTHPCGYSLCHPQIQAAPGEAGVHPGHLHHSCPHSEAENGMYS